AVIDRYKDRVRVWETINEPNAWTDGPHARIDASVFAKLHARVWQQTKGAHPSDACWNVSILTGPLFSFDGQSSATFFDNAIAAGRASGPWKAIRDATGEDPLDGVAYHVYVAQGDDYANSDIAPSGNANLNAIRGVMNKYSISSDKKIWLSEVGWKIPL